MINEKLKESLDRLLKALNPNDTWIPCPSCRLEWNKLRKCDFWNGRYVEQSFLCVRCAEKAAVFPWLNETYPIPGVTIDVKPYAALISGNGMTFKVDELPGGHDGSQHFKITLSSNSEQPVFKNNSIAVWFWIREQMEKGDNPMSGLSGWSKFKVIRGKNR